MARRQLKPYRQGQLDGLCGVYALINALRLLCPRLDEDACERAFCALIQARARQAASPLTVIHAGLSWRELLRLIGVWQRFAHLGSAWEAQPAKKCPRGAGIVVSSRKALAAAACPASTATCLPDCGNDEAISAKPERRASVALGTFSLCALLSETTNKRRKRQ